MDFERRFGSGTLNGVGEGQAHMWRLCGNKVENTVGCRLVFSLRRSGHVSFEGGLGGDERGSASLMANAIGIDCWLRRGNCKVGSGWGASQSEGMLEAEICWSSLAACLLTRERIQCEIASGNEWVSSMHQEEEVENRLLNNEKS